MFRVFLFYFFSFNDQSFILFLLFGLYEITFFHHLVSLFLTTIFIVYLTDSLLMSHLLAIKNISLFSGHRLLIIGPDQNLKSKLTGKRWNLLSFRVG